MKEEKIVLLFQTLQYYTYNLVPPILLCSMEAMMHSMHSLLVHTNFSAQIDCTAEVPCPASCGCIM